MAHRYNYTVVVPVVSAMFVMMPHINMWWVVRMVPGPAHIVLVYLVQVAVYSFVVDYSRIVIGPCFFWLTG